MVVTNYQQALDYLYENLPMFQRVGPAAMKPDLINTIELCRIVGNPEKKFRSVHVGGTNGKGSTSHMLASIFQSAGYKTGLFTSPHLKEFTERIKVNGKEVPPDFVTDFVNRLHPSIQRIRPSFFELTVAMAFDYFASEVIDVGVIEVGLGGRLDSTNVINPLISVITNIGWDHKDLLGNTLREIAAEKAGIIKKDTPVVISERQPEVEEVFTDKARAENAPLVFASDHYRAKFSEGGPINVFKDSVIFLEDIDLPLQGLYQEKNLAGVLQGVELLGTRGLPVSASQLRHGLEHVILQTDFKGRWQKLRDSPMVICDTGHNLDGVASVVKQLQAQKYQKLHMVWGMVKDKDIGPILSILPKQASYYFCQAKIPRAMDAAALSQLGAAVGLKGVVVPDVNMAITTALKSASTDDLIFIGGSTFVVAEIEDL